MNAVLYRRAGEKYTESCQAQGLGAKKTSTSSHSPSLMCCLLGWPWRMVKQLPCLSPVPPEMGLPGWTQRTRSHCSHPRTLTPAVLVRNLCPSSPLPTTSDCIPNTATIALLFHWKNLQEGTKSGSLEKIYQSLNKRQGQHSLPRSALSPSYL